MHLTRYGRIVKHDGRYRLQADDWRRAYDRATSIRDRFPAVEELVVRVTFTDRHRFGTYSSLMHSFSPSAKAFVGSPALARNAWTAALTSMRLS